MNDPCDGPLTPQVEQLVVEIAHTESHVRSMLKALSWRIVATTTTTTIAYFLIGQIDTALKIGGIEFCIKFFIYYFHERVWQLVPRGAIRRLFAKK